MEMKLPESLFKELESVLTKYNLGIKLSNIQIITQPVGRQDFSELPPKTKQIPKIQGNVDFEIYFLCQE